MTLMNKDMVVIPLRVTRETRKEWRKYAAEQDKSVQAWILGMINVTLPVEDVRDCVDNLKNGG